jgi:hypothetical protein
MGNSNRDAGVVAAGFCDATGATMSNDAQRLVGVTKLAELLGVNKSSVTRACQAGRLTFVPGKRGPLFDPEVARVEWENVDIDKRLATEVRDVGKPKPSSAGAAELTGLKTELAAIELGRRRIEDAEYRRSVVPVAEMRREVGGVLSTVIRDTETWLGVVADEVAQKLGTDARAVELELRRSFRSLRQRVARTAAAYADQVPELAEVTAS